MNNNQLEKALSELNKMISRGAILEAFEKYYDDAVIMQENTEAPVVSKANNRVREVEFVNNLISFDKAEVKAMGINNDQVLVLWHFEYNHREWGFKNYDQVAIQTWKGGKIISERFIYSN